MKAPVETTTPPNVPKPMGPYSHIAKVGNFITVSGTAGSVFETSDLVGPDAYSQAKQTIANFRAMLRSVGSDLDCIVHVNVFLMDMSDYAEMNRGYAEAMGDHRPARTVIGVQSVPRAGAVLTMNLTAVTRDG
jgi:2-iminobutanoate/2-iminopropanoate deaminase